MIDYYLIIRRKTTVGSLELYIYDILYAYMDRLVTKRENDFLDER